MRSGGTGSSWETDDVRIFRRTVSNFVERKLVPNQERWSAQGFSDPEIWLEAGRLGLLLPDVPREYGGGGGTFAHEAVIIEELARGGAYFGCGIQSIVAHYILAYGGVEQKRRWLPRMADGELIAAIAMTEPSSGSDLQAMGTTARREGDCYIVNGSKTFITNGRRANLVCLAVRTDAQCTGPRALSLLLVETDKLAGFYAGPPLQKIGRHAQDTCELFFDNARVPAINLLGASEGRGLFQMLDQLTYERLSIALNAVAAAEHAVAITTRYVKDRKVSGKSLLDLQNTRLKLAECMTEAHIGRVFVDDCIQRFIAGHLDSVTAAMAKYWMTDRQCRIIDECVQLHGGYGYMHEYPIARMWVDSRVQRIYGGSNEVMKDMIGRSL